MMRLLEIEAGGEFTLTEFLGSDIPPYAILSHTWGSVGEDVTFKDLVDQTTKDKAGYAKIQFCAQRAASDDLRFFWVDSCCIDKSSSAELTEAINSMFQWYRNAARCYVYLCDVSAADAEQADNGSWKAAFLQSRWFSRGWTLQELIAPASVEFFSKEGERLGDKNSLEKEITDITKIDVRALRGNPLSGFSVAERLSWAASRSTTREEDNAYCLLGIFDVYMPLIYGEGRRAFARLNEEVEKSSKYFRSKNVISSPTEISRTLQKSDLDRAELIQWLKHQDPYTNHLAAQRKKQKLTGSWFLRGEQYKEWQGGTIPLLWISGSPGSGKTVLCSTIIQDLLENSATDASAMMAYYYFDFGEAEKRTLDSFVRSLIVQLTANLPEMPQDLLDLYAYTRDHKPGPSTEKLKGVLHAIMMKSAEVVVAVDALDECSQPEELVQFIGEMRSWKTADLRLLVVSRHHFEGTEALKELEPIRVSIQDEATNNDIMTFVQEILNKDLKFKYWPLKVKNEIQTALVSESSGMFRWVACQIDVLKKCRTQQDIDTVLLTLPRTLEETYDRIFDAVSDTWRAEVRAVLQWLAFSKRPMRLEEVAEIVAFDAPHTTFDVNRRLLNPQEILTMCSSFIVGNETYYRDYNSDSGSIPITELRLAHFTVKDYLLSRSLQQSRHSYYSIEGKSSNLQIAKACLTYLNMDQFSSGYQEKAMQRAIERQWPLLSYAAKFCGDHLRVVENDLDLSARNLLQKLLSTHILPKAGNFGLLVGTAWSTTRQELIETTNPIYFAASSGLVSVLRLLLIDVAAVDLEARGGRYGSSPLQVASYRGHTDCVKLLLAAGADPNSTNYLKETPLFWARSIGSDEIVNLLRAYGATR